MRRDHLEVNAPRGRAGKMARKARNVYSTVQMAPRMSWHPANLFALHERSLGQRAQETVFKASNRSVHWQRFRSKALLRGYHGDWIQEKRFKSHWLPANLPRVQHNRLGQKAEALEQSTPVTSMMWVELERRLDVAVFRACFADSIYEARRMVIHGAVRLNGAKVSFEYSCRCRYPNTLLMAVAMLPHSVRTPGLASTPGIW